MAYKGNAYSVDYLAKGILQQFLDKESVVQKVINSQIAIKDVVRMSFKIATEFLDMSKDLKVSSETQVYDNSALVVDGEFD